jgi:hypothetical protein
VGWLSTSAVVMPGNVAAQTSRGEG